MSRQTPKRGRHQRQSSSGQGHSHGHTHRTVAASDYESDAQYADPQNPTHSSAQPPGRSNEELNIGVLKRYVPSIQNIASIAANAVVYIINPETHVWDKTNIEGTLFVCDQEPLVVATSSMSRACVFVLNRRSLDNAMVDLAKVSICEVQGELLSIKAKGASLGNAAADTGDATEKVLGLWIHADKEDTREVNYSKIQELWQEVTRGTKSMSASGMMGTVPESQAGREQSVGPAMQVAGRRLSISDLFGQQNGAGS